MTIQELKNNIDNSIPNCIKKHKVEKSELPEYFDDNFKSIYKLSCKCGSELSEIIGYYLRDYNKAVSKKDNSMITPLGLKCATCKTVTEILDTKEHGYHPELAKLEGDIDSVKYRGEGPRVNHKCPYCSNKVFNKIIAGFVYWNLDEMVEEPALPWQNFFSVFLFYTTCGNCNKTSEPINLGKL